MNSFNEKNKEEIAEIIKKIPKSISDRNFNRILNELIWSATADFQEIKDDCKYKLPIWSVEAIEKLKTNIQNKKNNIFIGLIHEHLYPKKLIRKDIRSSIDNKESIQPILHNFAHAAIITKKENETLSYQGYHQNIPEEYNQAKPLDKLFSRYIKTGIDLKFVDWRDKQNALIQDSYYLKNKCINHEFIKGLSFNDWKIFKNKEYRKLI